MADPVAKGGARPPSTKKDDPDWRHKDAEALWSEHLGWMVDDVRRTGEAAMHLVLNEQELRAALAAVDEVREALQRALGSGK